MLYYRLEGSGAPLLLIHGWGVTYAIWQSLAPLLTPHFQLIMIELPGIGRSPAVDPQQLYYPACAEAIEEVRQELAIEQWSILAYSSGTRVAEAYIQRYPEHINRATLLCPIYLTGLCSLGVRLLDTTHPPQIFKNWLFSNWRLYSFVRALGFNGGHHDYTKIWQTEIESQPLETLVRSLCELPGMGRTPFTQSTVPTLFVWGSRDVLTARPRRPSPNDVIIPVNHSAPMLAASSVAEVVLPFLKEGLLAPSPQRKWKRWQSWRKRDLEDAQEKVRLLTLLRNTRYKRFSLRKQRKTVE